MRRFATLALIAALGCSREQPIVDSAAGGTVQAPPPRAAAPAAAVDPIGTYDKAMRWMGSTRGFRFVLTEGSTKAEGELTRSTPGAETVTVTLDGVAWTATARPNGVIWSRGGKTAAAPPNASRIYQRLTLALDPQKVEGAPQLVATEAAVNHYRFTNAVTREVHHVWVDTQTGYITRFRIESSDNPVEMTITGVKG